MACHGKRCREARVDLHRTGTADPTDRRHRADARRTRLSGNVPGGDRRTCRDHKGCGALPLPEQGRADPRGVSTRVGGTGQARRGRCGGSRPGTGPEAYIREMIGHLRRHPSHTRMIIEAITHKDEQPDQDPAVRWQALAGVLAEAREANGLPPTDQRTAALVIGGAIDALVAEHLRDPSFETAAAAEELIELVGSAWRG